MMILKTAIAAQYNLEYCKSPGWWRRDGRAIDNIGRITFPYITKPKVVDSERVLLRIMIVHPNISTHLKTKFI
jgi:hypothetical protein